MERCKAYEAGRQCLRRKNLTHVVIETHRRENSPYQIPIAVSVELCPKHFVRKPWLEAKSE
jgi:hypothetical protein